MVSLVRVRVSPSRRACKRGFSNGLAARQIGPDTPWALRAFSAPSHRVVPIHPEAPDECDILGIADRRMDGEWFMIRATDSQFSPGISTCGSTQARFANRP